MNSLTKRSAVVVYRNLAASQHSIRLSHGEAKPRKWARWQDVPDDWVLPSKRMPENPFYQTDEWKKFKKMQIFYQQDDGLPVWLKRGYPYNYLHWLVGVLFAISLYGAVTGLIDGHVFPKKAE